MKKKFILETGKFTDKQMEVMIGLFCDVLGSEEMADITLKPHEFTIEVETLAPSKDNISMALFNKIKNINRILDKCFDGEVTTAELEADSSPCLSSTGTNKMNISTLVERFSINNVVVITYNNETEIAEDDMPYEALDEDIIDEITELLEQAEVEYDKTLERCM
jgi:hypothetical protein